jgi:hypothetical protein
LSVKHVEIALDHLCIEDDIFNLKQLSLLTHILVLHAYVHQLFKLLTLTILIFQRIIKRVVE